MATKSKLAELETAIIEDSIAGVKTMTVDGVTVVGLTPKERLEARKELQAEETAKLPNFGLRSRRLDSPGGWGDR